MDIINMRKGILDNNNGKKLVNRNMVLFLLGKLVSLFGSSFYTFAIGIYIMAKTGSGLSFAITIFLGTIPRALFSPFAGVMVDKYDRKKLVVALDIISGIIVLMLFATGISGEFKLGYIYATTFLLNVANIFFANAITSSTPNLVDDENLTKINSLSTTIDQGSSILGPLLGALIYALVDIKIFLLINGLSFIVSGISEMFLDFKVRDKIYGEKPIEEKEEKKMSFWGDFSEGMRYILSQKWLIVLGITITFANMIFTIAFNVPLPYIAYQVWHVTEFQYSLIMIACPAGMTIASLLVAMIPQSEKNFKRLTGGLFVFGLGCIIIGLVVSQLTFSWGILGRIIALCLILVGIGFSMAFLNIPLMVTLQKLIPNELLGRVMGVILSLGALLIPVGALIGGCLVDMVDPWIIPTGCGVLLIFMTLIIMRNKELRKF